MEKSRQLIRRRKGIHHHQGVVESEQSIIIQHDVGMVVLRGGNDASRQFPMQQEVKAGMLTHMPGLYLRTVIILKRLFDKLSWHHECSPIDYLQFKQRMRCFTHRDLEGLILAQLPYHLCALVNIQYEAMLRHAICYLHRFFEICLQSYYKNPTLRTKAQHIYLFFISLRKKNRVLRKKS